ncbi:hypothetical protein BDZ31_003483 [Conexibacter arvalis]|uniref:Uncharacterized protein n=1 Tax=Conexibacter arvalis TaxID=912552 RepID=A0A840IGA3_9ACTN|nr:hypothetical protein [Conexibacter arvalis]MBB4663882.1 hypothetical protein [Conexibacter arvalis]
MVDVVVGDHHLLDLLDGAAEPGARRLQAADRARQQAAGVDQRERVAVDQPGVDRADRISRLQLDAVKARPQSVHRR